MTNTPTAQSLNGSGQKTPGSENSSNGSQASGSKLERVAELLGGSDAADSSRAQALDGKPLADPAPAKNGEGGDRGDRGTGDAAGDKPQAIGDEDALASEIARLAAGDDAGEAQGDRPEVEGGKKPKTLQEAAERLGVTPADLYGMEFPIGEGQTVSLGDLKDRFKETAGILAEASAKEARIAEREGALVADQRLLSEMSDTLKATLPADQLKALEDRQTAWRQREARDLLQMMPELQKPGEFQAMVQRVSGFTERMGVSMQKVQALGSADVYRVLDYAAKMQARLDRIAELGAKHTRKTPATSRRPDNSQNSNRIVQAAKKGTPADKIKAVSQLIR